MNDYPFLDPPQMRGADSLPVRMTTRDMIDLDRVAAHIDRAVKSGRYKGPTDPVDYLLHKYCVVAVGDDVYPTLAGILCFGREPQTVFPNAVVDLGHYGGTQPVSYDVVHLEKNIGGTIFEQIERVDAYLSRNTRHGMTLGAAGPRRVELHEYPPAVIRELNVNMLAHRDYTVIGSAARVLLFRNRIEWASPGGLPPGVTEDNLLAMQTARNPVLLSILYEAGYVEAYGMGLDTVVSVLEAEGLQAPRFKDLVGAAFIVTVHGRPLESRDQAPYVELGESQRRIVRIVSSLGEATLGDIREALPDRSKRTLQDDITKLIEAGLIERHGQTKATRYRLRVEGNTSREAIDSAH
jgi:ATP-dependent DNA helicase RecG